MKTLIRLGGSKSSLGPRVILLVLSCGGSNIKLICHSFHVKLCNEIKLLKNLTTSDTQKIVVIVQTFIVMVSKRCRWNGKSVDPDQPPPSVWSCSTLFAQTHLSECLGSYSIFWPTGKRNVCHRKYNYFSPKPKFSKNKLSRWNLNVWICR